MTAPVAKRPYGVPLAALLIGATLWPIGARYSIDGLLWIINQLLLFLRVAYQIPTPPIWQVYAVLAPISIPCSRVEWSLSFRRLPSAIGAVVWLSIVGYDLLTTLFGVLYPDAGAWAVTRQIAQSLALSGILSIVLTFGPEWLMREGWRALRR
jgi:hypothetical protein